MCRPAHTTGKQARCLQVTATRVRTLKSTCHRSKQCAAITDDQAGNSYNPTLQSRQASTCTVTASTPTTKSRPSLRTSPRTTFQGQTGAQRRYAQGLCPLSLEGTMQATLQTMIRFAHNIAATAYRLSMCMQPPPPSASAASQLVNTSCASTPSANFQVDPVKVTPPRSMLPADPHEEFNSCWAAS